MAATESRHLVWLSGQAWDCVSGSDRSMAVALSDYLPVLWVDSPVSPVTGGALRGPLSSRSWPKISKISERMTRLTTVALPGLTRPGVRSTTPALVRAQVRWAMGNLGVKPAAVVMAYLGDLLGGWGDGVVNVLYGTDDYVAGAEFTGMSVRHLLARERTALARADVITVVSPQIAERWANLGASAVVIRNGCWPDKGEVPPQPAELADLPHPVIGLVGYLSNRIDMEILMSVAGTGFTFLIVGDKDPRWEQRRFRELTGKSNVRYVGPVPSAAVRSYMSAIDIGITPYSDSAFNRASFPLKTLEYLGAGVPVVSTSLPAVRWLRDDLEADLSASAADQLLLLADSAADFGSAIDRMTSNTADAGSARAKNCVAFAERHSWPRRAAEFAAAVGLI